MGKQWKEWETLFGGGGGSKITADSVCSHEIKRHLFLGRKAMTHLHIILKSRYITLPTKVRLVKAMIFPVVMYEYKSWTIEKAEHWRIDAFELWCWRRLLGVPWTARISNQSILKEISPEYSLKGLMFKLKLQYFGYLMWRADSFEMTLMLGKIESWEEKGWGWDGWMASPLNGHEFEKTPGVGNGQYYSMDWCAAVHGFAKTQTPLSNWTATKFHCFDIMIKYDNVCEYV